jgi:hypothetical protein
VVADITFFSIVSVIRIKLFIFLFAFHSLSVTILAFVCVDTVYKDADAISDGMWCSCRMAAAGKVDNVTIHQPKQLTQENSTAKCLEHLQLPFGEPYFFVITLSMESYIFGIFFSQFSTTQTINKTNITTWKIINGMGWLHTSPLYYCSRSIQCPILLQFQLT